ncbi:LOW QUALITY PROTEIN: quinolinate synthetase complex, subunit A, partial [Streptomyces sp. e14]
RGHPVRRRHGRLLQAGPRRRRAAGRGVHRVLRCALHGGVRRHPDERRAEGRPAGPGRRVLDGRHGDGRAGRRVLGRADRGRHRRAGRAGVVHELLGRHQGVHRQARRHHLHLVQREARPDWAFEQGEKVLFLPDQHLGRNTAVRDMGMSLEDCVVYNPHRPNGGLTAEELRAAKMILWRGHCSVHGRFSLDSVEDVRARIPGVNVLVHPECKHEVVAAADYVGSTEYIIKALEAAPAGSKWAIGTELNLVRRLANRFAPEGKEIVFLDRTVCFCSTMNRIDLPHLVWTLESLAEGNLVNRIEVDKETEAFAKLALERMLALP